jgi:hypothetical protein
MQSLQSGMAMVGVDAPFQNIVVGIVLVARRLIDIIYRKRTGDRQLTHAQTAPARPLVEMRDISISFGGVKAVDHVTIDLYPGEVVGLLGHNGAGKSTLIKCLSGAYKMDSGQIFINGEPATINNPRDARRYNIETIYQTLALADNLDAARTCSSGASWSRRSASSTTRDGGRDAQDHGAAQPELPQVQGAGEGAVGRAAAVGRHRAGGLLQREGS